MKITEQEGDDMDQKERRNYLMNASFEEHQAHFHFPGTMRFLFTENFLTAIINITYSCRV